LSDAHFGDSSLEVCVGAHNFIGPYYKDDSKNEGLNIQRTGPYIVGLLESRNADLMDDSNWIYVSRIGANWKPENLEPLPSNPNALTRPEICKWTALLKKEVEETHGEPPKEGDFVIWAPMAPHQNGDKNETNFIRRAMYNTYLFDIKENENLIKEQLVRRESGDHPPTFPAAFNKIEKKNGFPLLNLNEIGKKVYGYEKWADTDESLLDKLYNAFPLSERHIAFFNRYGFVVVENVFPKELTRAAANQTAEFLKKSVNIDLNDLENTLTSEKWFSIANRFGGTLELYWLSSMDEIRQHPNGYSVLAKLLAATWAKKEREPWIHPYGDIDPRKLYLYIDRQNLRFPSKIVDDIFNRDKGLLEDGQ